MTPLYIESAILLNSKKWQHLRESLTEINIAASPSQNAASSATDHIYIVIYCDLGNSYVPLIILQFWKVPGAMDLTRWITL